MLSIKPIETDRNSTQVDIRLNLNHPFLLIDISNIISYLLRPNSFTLLPIYQYTDPNSHVTSSISVTSTNAASTGTLSMQTTPQTTFTTSPMSTSPFIWFLHVNFLVDLPYQSTVKDPSSLLAKDLLNALNIYVSYLLIS